MKSNAQPAFLRIEFGPPSRLRTPRDVSFYFDYDIKVKAPFDAVSLREEVVADMDGRKHDEG